MPPGDGATGICLDADEPGCQAAVHVGIVEHRRLLPFPGLDIGEEDSIVIALHNDLIFKPNIGHERGARRVVLHGRLVEVQVPDAVASLNFVDRAGTIFKQTIRLRLDAIKILAESPRALSSI